MTWRPIRTQRERLDRALTSMAPGSRGLAVASPVPTRNRQRTPIPPEAEDDIQAGGVAFYRDRMVSSGPGNQTITLSYEPVPLSEKVYWNGVYQSQSIWSRTGRMITVGDGSQSVNAGDEIVVAYAYMDEVAVRQPSTWALLAMAKGATIVLDLDDTTLPIENWAASVEGTLIGTGGRLGQGSLFPNARAAVTVLNDQSGVASGSATPNLIDVSVEVRMQSSLNVGYSAYLAGNRGPGSHGWKVGLGPTPMGQGSVGMVHFGVDGGGVWQGVSTQSTFNDGKRHHVVCVYDHPGSSGSIVQSGMKIYVDGVQRTTDNRSYVTTSVPLPAPGEWKVAANVSTDQGGPPGTYEGFAVYPNKALTAGDVADLYNEAMRPAA